MNDKIQPKSHDCNEFIIRDNQFIRDFEGMYREFEDPWNQAKKSEEDLLNQLAIFFLRRVIGFDCHRILDIGCADGYFAKSLLSITSNPATKYIGTDISATVIERANKKYSNEQTNFIVDDIRNFNPEFKNNVDLIYCAKTIYYVSPEIDVVMNNIYNYLKINSYFCFNYNQREKSFSNQFLTYLKLRDKILESSNFKEVAFLEMNRFSSETEVVGIFQKVK